MKLRFLALLTTVLLIAGANVAEPAPAKLRVLFIGNSLTSRNNLPGIIAAMAAASGRELTYFPNLVDSATLKKHWTDGKALAKIKEEHWDYVVLQDQSKAAFTDREAMFRTGRLFDTEIRKAGAQPVFYMTWALEEAPSDFPAIADAYTTLAAELQARLVPVGAAWHAVTSSPGKPAWQLYMPDHRHPTPAGSYLAACLFYRVLFGVPSAGLPNRIVWKEHCLVDLPQLEAAALQKIADATAVPARACDTTAHGK